jgi:histidine triad (HIT) family protein
VHAPEGYECPFCAVVRGEEREPPGTRQTDVVLRSPTTTAWIGKRWWENNAGHVIVVPNVHVENMYELPRELAGDIHESARAVALAMKRAYRCDGISTRQHNEPGGDQDVWHYHLHVFPRYEGDGLYGSSYRETTPEERRPYAERLRDELAQLSRPPELSVARVAE